VTTPTLLRNDAADEACSVGSVMIGSGFEPGELVGGLDGGSEGGFEGGLDEGVDGEFAVADVMDAMCAVHPSKPVSSI
jgi:hypothetical protein